MTFPISSTNHGNPFTRRSNGCFHPRPFANARLAASAVEDHQPASILANFIKITINLLEACMDRIGLPVPLGLQLDSQYGAGVSHA
jgi:hypothetical protein